MVAKIELSVSDILLMVLKAYGVDRCRLEIKQTLIEQLDRFGYQIIKKQEPKIEKEFLVICGEGFIQCEDEAQVIRVKIDFFNDDNGYCDEDIETYDKLELGQSVFETHSGNHTVVRVK